MKETGNRNHNTMRTRLRPGPCCSRVKAAEELPAPNNATIDRGSARVQPCSYRAALLFEIMLARRRNGARKLSVRCNSGNDYSTEYSRVRCKAGQKRTGCADGPILRMALRTTPWAELTRAAREERLYCRGKRRQERLQTKNGYPRLHSSPFYPRKGPTR